MKYKYILFDFDGTLADTECLAVAIYARLARIYGLKEIEPDELPLIKKMTVGELIRYVNAKKRQLPFILRRAKKMLSGEIHTAKPCRENWQAVLRELKDKRNYKIGILTSNSKKNVRKFLEGNNLELFDVLLSSSLLGKGAKLKRFLRKNNLTSDDVIYIGDEIRDIQAAKRANIDSASVSWGYNSIDSLQQQNPEFILYDADDLLSIC